MKVFTIETLDYLFQVTVLHKNIWAIKSSLTHSFPEHDKTIFHISVNIYALIYFHFLSIA